MSEILSQNKALMRRIYEEMWNAGNPAMAAEIFVQQDGGERFVREFLMALRGLTQTIHEMVEEGDHVAVQFSASGTHRGAWMQFSPTGKSIQYTGVTIARIVTDILRDRILITEHHTWWDKMGLLDQIRK